MTATDPIADAVHASLGSYLDDDTRDYITSLLSEDYRDSDAQEAVVALVAASCDEEADGDPEFLCDQLFRLLDDAESSSSRGDLSSAATDAEKFNAPLRMLGQTVTMKENDVQTFAMGLSAEREGPTPMTDEAEEAQQSQIAAFYANMIDATNDPAAMSERARRKGRQKALREKMEEEERERAIQDTMAMLDDSGNGDSKGKEEGEDVFSSADDNAADVHLRDFDLPNLRGGGPDLLSGASLTLSRGRRYGLMGRNGCGKTTLMSFAAARKVPGGVPKKMSMLLVRQEVMGNELSAVATVLKSDVKREGVKKFISWCEEEIEKLEKDEKDGSKEGVQPLKGADVANVVDLQIETTKEKKPKKDGKGRQKLRERKKQGLQKKRLNTSAASTAIAPIAEPSIETRKASLTEKLARAYQHFSEIEEAEGGDPEPRARKVLSGLGFSTEMQDKPTRELSGGWRMRVSLSCALFADPALLLLDEPTNHLDLEAVLWLERYLTTKFRGTLVVVSHDRHFLNEVVTDVVHFHRSKLTTYRGDISNFEAVREEDKQRQIRLFDIQEAKRQHLQKYIDLHAQSGENGVKAAKQRKSRMKKMDKLGVMAQEGRRYKASYDGDVEEVVEYETEDKVELIFSDPGSFNGSMVKLEQVTFGYSPDKILLKNIDLTIDLKSRAALLGRNGCGKSTLIKLVVGALNPLNGKSTIDPRAKIEYLAQHQLEQLDADSTPLKTMVDRYPGDRSNTHIGELRRYLANFGLGGEVLPNQKIHTMSGGQKCRLCLALAMHREPHLLILDEPTNHLDLETTEALIEAINNFKGGVLLVSHDQHLLTSVCKNLYVVEDGKVEELRGGTTNSEAFEAYKKAVVQGRR